MVSKFMDWSFVTKVVMSGGEHGSGSWSESSFGMLLLLCCRFFDSSLACGSVLETFRLAVALPLAETTGLVAMLNWFFSCLFLGFLAVPLSAIKELTTGGLGSELGVLFPCTSHLVA